MMLNRYPICGWFSRLIYVAIPAMFLYSGVAFATTTGSTNPIQNEQVKKNRHLQTMDPSFDREIMGRVTDEKGEGLPGEPLRIWKDNIP